jgi:hypothetical protein
MSWILYKAEKGVRKLSVQEAAWLAGFMDGEGTLTIGRATRSESRSGFSYEALMVVSNTEYDVLVGIVDMCGGGKVQRSNVKKAAHHKDGFRAIWSANEIRRLLPQIRPFLRVKGKQADILLRFLESKVAGRNVTAELWQSFERLRAEVRGLNQRGAVEVSESALTVRPVAEMPRKPVRMCEVDGCIRRHFSKGMCHMHYRKLIQRPAFRSRLVAVPEFLARE